MSGQSVTAVAGGSIEKMPGSAEPANSPKPESSSLKDQTPKSPVQSDASKAETAIVTANEESVEKLSLKEKLYYDVWTRYWLEAIVGLIAILMGLGIGLAIGFGGFPAAQPKCIVKSVGPWLEWSSCSVTCRSSEKSNGTIERERKVILADGSTDIPSGCFANIEIKECSDLPFCCQIVGQSYGGSDYCYDVVPSERIWTKARSTTGFREKANLVSIHSMEEQNFIFNLTVKMRNSTVELPEYGIKPSWQMDKVWIGLQCWGSVGYCTWSDRSEMDFFGFTSHFKVTDFADLCVYMNEQGFWETDYCSESYGFVTKSANLSRVDCPTKFNDCYKIERKLVSWDEAKKSQLVTINTLQEQLYLIKLMTKDGLSNKDKLWIGLKCVVDDFELFWCQWRDGSSVTFTNWDIDGGAKYKEQCVYMDIHGLWYGSDCHDEKFWYITETNTTCDKVGQPIWTSWSPCSVKCGQGEHSRYQYTPITNNHSSCPSSLHTKVTREQNKCRGQCVDTSCKAPTSPFDYCYRIESKQKATYHMVKERLVTINSAKEEVLINDLTKRAKFPSAGPVHLLLIGLRCTESLNVDSCRWWNDEYLRYNHFVNPSQPNVPETIFQCVALKYDSTDTHFPTFEWISVRCDRNLSYIQEQSPNCPKDYKLESSVMSLGKLKCDRLDGRRGRIVQKPINCPSCSHNMIGNYPCTSCHSVNTNKTKYCYKIVNDDSKFVTFNFIKETNEDNVTNYFDLFIPQTELEWKLVSNMIHEYMKDKGIKSLSLHTGIYCHLIETNCFTLEDPDEQNSFDINQYKQFGIEIEMGGKREFIVAIKGAIDDLDAFHFNLALRSSDWKGGYLLETAPSCPKNRHRFADVKYDLKDGSCGVNVYEATNTINLPLNCPKIVESTEFVSHCCKGMDGSGEWIVTDRCYGLAVNQHDSLIYKAWTINSLMPNIASYYNQKQYHDPALRWIWESLVKSAITTRTNRFFIGIKCKDKDTNWEKKNRMCYNWDNNDDVISGDYVTDFDIEEENIDKPILCLGYVLGKSSIYGMDCDKAGHFIVQYRRYSYGEEPISKCGRRFLLEKKCPSGRK